MFEGPSSRRDGYSGKQQVALTVYHMADNWGIEKFPNEIGPQAQAGGFSRFSTSPSDFSGRQGINQAAWLLGYTPSKINGLAKIGRGLCASRQDPTKS